ncbi:MAG: dienelactone hydrolase [Pseudomonadales bacterium]|nr:dienelactone hydrolase [Pseudomonadales bacterium]
MLEGYEKHHFSAQTAQHKTIGHDIYTCGDQRPTIVIIQELPGIGPETLALADRFTDQGYRVVLPHLFGPLGKVSLGGNLLRVFCMRKEFHLFAKKKSSPIVDWLKALCRDLKDNHGAGGIGVIGMCLTGNFAMSLMADENVLAGVASQPSMPLNKQSELHMSDTEITSVRQRLDQQGSMIALRFAGDVLCTAEKFKAIDRAFNDDAERIRLIELPGKGHSVLTLDFIKGGQLAEDALQEVLSYFASQLKTV